MATIAKDTCASDIYEDTNFMQEAGTPEEGAVNTQYESLRMEDRHNSNANAAATRKGKCGKRRWWCIAIVILCVGVSAVTSMYTSV